MCPLRSRKTSGDGIREWFVTALLREKLLESVREEPFGAFGVGHDLVEVVRIAAADANRAALIAELQPGSDHDVGQFI